MKQTAIAFLLVVLIAGCTSSQPAPKSFKWESDTKTTDAQKKEKEAEAKSPCSEVNLKNASEEQKKKCDPTKGMFDNVHPKQPDRKEKKSAPKQTPQQSPQSTLNKS